MDPSYRSPYVSRRPAEPVNIPTNRFQKFYRGNKGKFYSFFRIRNEIRAVKIILVLSIGFFFYPVAREVTKDAIFIMKHPEAFDPFKISITKEEKEKLLYEQRHPPAFGVLLEQMRDKNILRKKMELEREIQLDEAKAVRKARELEAKAAKSQA